MPAWTRQDVSYREAAAFGLFTGLAEVGLQLGSVGHGERRAVDEECAMAEPATHRLGGGIRPLTIAEDGLVDGQRESGAGLTEADAVRARPANNETWVKAVLPWRI